MPNRLNEKKVTANAASISTLAEFIAWIRCELRSLDSHDQNKPTDWHLYYYSRKFDEAKSLVISLDLPAEAMEALGSYPPDGVWQRDETTRRLLCNQIRIKFKRLLDWLSNSDQTRDTKENRDARNTWFVEQRNLGQTWDVIYRNHFSVCEKHGWKHLTSQTAIAKAATKHAAKSQVHLPKRGAGGRPKEAL
jgi:hypothetical protein